MKNKIMRTLLSLVLLAAVAVGGTMAYLFASDDAVVNNFELAQVGTSIDEPSTGTAGEKDPKVSNTGKSPVYVRVRLSISGVTAGTVTPVIDTANWAYNSEDGFYYYKAILQSGQTTAPVFTDVTVTDVPITDSFDILVYQESVLAPQTVSGDVAAAAKAAFIAKDTATTQK